MFAYQISMNWRKPEISPENGKCKHEFSQVMQVLFISVFQVTYYSSGNTTNKVINATPAYKCACKGVPAIHGAVPMCIDTHQPKPGNR